MVKADGSHTNPSVHVSTPQSAHNQQDLPQSQQFSQTQAWNAQPPGLNQGVQARLVSTTMLNFTFELMVEHKEVLIGRHPGCQIQVKDKHVSSHHLRIYRDDASRYFVEELGSSGCFINDQFMKKGEHRALSHGDAITIGEKPQAGDGISIFAGFIFRVADGKGNFDSSDEGSPIKGGISGASTRLPSNNSEVPDQRNRVTEDWLKRNWDVNHVLGSGNFSEVRLGVDVKKGEKFAVKIIDKKKFWQFQSKRDSQLSLSDEADVLKCLNHRNIVKCFEWFQTEVQLYLVMELVGGGDLLQCILEHGRFSERQARRLFKQLCDAVCYLHMEMNIVHRDLKPENILLASKDRNTMIPKIADFGLARKNMKSRDCRTFCGTPHYFAPEVISTFRDKDSCQKAGYGKQADMWSLGVILYILLSGIPPFEEEGLYEQITEGRYEFDVAEWTTVSQEAKDLVRSLMTVNPKVRLTIQQALEDKWLRFPGMMESPTGRLATAVPTPCTANQSHMPKRMEVDDFATPVTKRRKSDITMH